jgi:hypothetical protein
MRTHVRLLTIAVPLTLLPPALVLRPSSLLAQHDRMPAGMTHEEHLRQIERNAELQRRGAAAMGFDQDRTTHQFRLTSTGGAVEVLVNDPADSANLSQVRLHLKAISAEFARGRFDKPFATHGEEPPGVETMQKRKAMLQYRYEELPTGGRVVIITSDREARNAVHEFLRYQIQEHGTGDPLTVSR